MRTLIGIVVAFVAAALFAMPTVAADPGPTAQIVRDINGGGGSDPRFLTRAGGLVFFSANDGVHGRELWATDGTRAGTRLVRDIRQGTPASGPTLLTRVGSRVFFTASDGTHGRELWVSDGTRGGTKMVRDFTPGAGGSSITGIADGSGAAYVALGGRELWRTDGTFGGTRLVRRFMGVEVESAVPMGSRLYFSANDALWKTGGTAVTTKRLSPSYWGIDGLIRYRGHIYYRGAAPLGAFGGIPELWWSDGTRAGTRQLGTMLNPTDLTVFGDRLYFDAMRSESTAPRLYRGDGSSAGTGPVSPRVRPLWEMAKHLGRLWSPGASAGQLGPDELWVSDGTAAGTSLVHGGTADWFIYDWEGAGHVGLAGRLWFTATPEATVGNEVMAADAEVWSSDGTPEGTVQAFDINPSGSSLPRGLVRLGQTVLFSAGDGVNGRELWSISGS
jgi:ELWxxDGT repeat protein